MNRPFYFKHGVIEFFIKKKQNFFRFFVWNEDGTNRSLISIGKYNGEDPKSLIPLVMKGDS
ncbi:hypothetical protein [Nitrososphaeria virus YSH_462411]|uniref:Uncharacterized protein n=1 Tax=Nitrososphaeria virus YSH_462411 TaxID=3071321 RepID=A0A976YF58_9CAUD|nr:hypothetical protein QKV92_gp65 [Yangshan Harbor Nitrososphaeria virus]UVF62337.1 hypothetical protein [Nitrososphaeria virus YSH_462411]